MAAKKEEKEDFFFLRHVRFFLSLSLSLSRSTRCNCHNINDNENNALTFAKEDANTFHAFLHQIHETGDRSFSISLSAKRERERERFCFPAFGV